MADVSEKLEALTVVEPKEEEVQESESGEENTAEQAGTEASSGATAAKKKKKNKKKKKAKKVDEPSAAPAESSDGKAPNSSTAIVSAPVGGSAVSAVSAPTPDEEALMKAYKESLNPKKKRKDNDKDYKFWSTQPVPKLCITMHIALELITFSGASRRGPSWPHRQGENSPGN